MRKILILLFTIISIAVYGQYEGDATDLTPNSSGVSVDSVHWRKTGNYIYPKVIGDSVGIGISSPEHKLEVWGNTKFSYNDYSSTSQYDTLISITGLDSLTSSPTSFSHHFLLNITDNFYGNDKNLKLYKEGLKINSYNYADSLRILRAFNIQNSGRGNFTGIVGNYFMNEFLAETSDSISGLILKGLRSNVRTWNKANSKIRLLGGTYDDFSVINQDIRTTFGASLSGSEVWYDKPITNMYLEIKDQTNAGTTHLDTVLSLIHI